MMCIDLLLLIIYLVGIFICLLHSSKISLVGEKKLVQFNVVLLLF